MAASTASEFFERHPLLIKMGWSKPDFCTAYANCDGKHFHELEKLLAETQSSLDKDASKDQQGQQALAASRRLDKRWAPTGDASAINSKTAKLDRQYSDVRFSELQDAIILMDAAGFPDLAGSV